MASRTYPLSRVCLREGFDSISHAVRHRLLCRSFTYALPWTEVGAKFEYI